jgi:hypothetical protein
MDQSGYIKSQYGALTGPLTGVGLAHLYDTGQWTAVSGRELNDHELAALACETPSKVALRHRATAAMASVFVAHI